MYLLLFLCLYKITFILQYILYQILQDFCSSNICMNDFYFYQSNTLLLLKYNFWVRFKHFLQKKVLDSDLTLLRTFEKTVAANC